MRFQHVAIIKFYLKKNLLLKLLLNFHNREENTCIVFYDLKAQRIKTVYELVKTKSDTYK